MLLRSLLGLLAMALMAGCVSPSQSPSSSIPAISSPPTSSAAPPSINPSNPGSTVPPLPTGPDALELAPFADGLEAPIGVTNAGDGSGLLYVNEQAGVVRVVSGDASVREQPFLDLSDRIGSGGERGLLGLAFHPEYATNRRLFVNYTDLDGDTVISELRASANGELADPDSEQVLLRVDQPYANHNGGQLAFGPDGYLYIGLGDGGSGGDPHGNGQNTNVLLGKILRIDVNAAPAEGRAYAIPPDNPFVNGGGAPEVWAYGLRNPWRFSFDKLTGDMYIGDVGQGQWEEIDRLPAGSAGGANFGWNVTEGRHCFQDTKCDQRAYLPPIAEYSHDGGNCSVTGGVVYRGTAQPELQGIYVLADYCSGRVFTLNVDEGTIIPKEVLKSDAAITSFGASEDGEIYATDQRGGRLLQVVLPK